MYYLTTNKTSQQRSVLASLRALVPQRPLAPREVLNVAELQANHLLRQLQIESSAVPTEIISDLPRIRVIREEGMPVSGSAHWNGRYWIIAVDADESSARQRFSVMHEFKHVLDHTTKHFLYYNRPFQTADEQAERVADYFAACLLMPKKVVKSLWYSGHQDITALAAKLQVSVPALRYRLDYLGLTETGGRCRYKPQLVPAMARPRARYFRVAAAPARLEALA
jgi:Zn-dependent peptidase ImmA (M78 family)